MRDFQVPGRSAVYATNGMCATSHPLAAQVAVAMLQDDGNAVDAAIAAALVLGIAEPQMTGIGGDLFALVRRRPGERPHGLNASGRAPAALSAAKLRGEGHETMPRLGAHSVTVPGAIDGFLRLSEDYGRKDIGAVIAPAIRYAEEGVPVAPRTAFDWARAADDLTGSARNFYLRNGEALRPGEVFRATGQAEVLRMVAEKGRAGFYEGPAAEDMVESLRSLGGTHTMEDFASSTCEYVEPISGFYGGVELIELPPNGQGATAILLANILSNFDLASMSPLGADRAHVEAEAAKLAYDARNRFIADPNTSAIRLPHLMSEETAKKLAALIDMDRAMDDPIALSEEVHRETVYLTVVDRDRMAVSMIYSVFSSFGSGLASDRYGINFQNRGAGFSLKEGHPNEAAGGKRPMHTIIPGMLAKDDEVYAPFGVMGGPYQPNGHARLLTNLVDYGMHPQQAIDAPRSFYESGELLVERGYDASVREALAAKGHKVAEPGSAIGGAQMIRIDDENGVLEGASDPRKDGCALGY